jgi:hypothetical protein
LTYTAYDAATSAAVKTIIDVDTTQTSDFTGLPSGWSTPTGGGLHLITTVEVDDLGRTTKMTDPNATSATPSSTTTTTRPACTPAGTPVLPVR